MDKRFLSWSDIDRAINKLVASIVNSEIEIVLSVFLLKMLQKQWFSSK